MTPDEVLIEAGRLAAEGSPYVLATVVRVDPPASTKRGDRALVTPDGPAGSAAPVPNRP